jgi:hypothetical protein
VCRARRLFVGAFCETTKFQIRFKRKATKRNARLLCFAQSELDNGDNSGSVIRGWSRHAYRKTQEKPGQMKLLIMADIEDMSAHPSPKNNQQGRGASLFHRAFLPIPPFTANSRLDPRRIPLYPAPNVRRTFRQN